MSAVMSLYFANLFEETRRNSLDNNQDSASDHDGEEQQQAEHDGLPAELIFDNARLPSPCIAQPYNILMGACNDMGDSSCHTRSTISTCNSTISTSSNQSNISASSVGSNSSTGSCRWDSNPSSHKEKSNTGMQLKRPRRPGRKPSDSTKNRSARVTATTTNTSPMVDIVAVRPELDSPTRIKKKCDKPVQPIRTSSNGSTSSSNSSSHRTEKRSNYNRRAINKKSNNKDKDNCCKSDHSLSSHSSSVSSASSSASLDKMLLHSKKMTTGHCDSSRSSSRDSDSSEHSLKEIFRTASQQRRSVSSGGSTRPLTAARTSPSRTVNEILGQSMEELQITW